MNFLRLPLLGRYALALVAAASSCYLTLHPSLRPPKERPREQEATEMDQTKREAWELMRLRDPVTGTIPEGMRRKELAFAATIPGSTGRPAFFKGSAVDDHVWTSRGPSNVGGRTRALGCDVDDERTILAGSATGGIWRTTNDGIGWKRMTPPGQFPSVTCLTQDTRTGKHNIWYYGTGEFRTNSTRFGNALYAGDGIFKSTDRGSTWSQLAATAVASPQRPDQPFNFVNAIAVDTTNHSEDEVYAAVMGGIARSTDGGDSWRIVLGGNQSPVGYTDVHVASDGTVYAAIGTGAAVHGLWRSADGINWTNITPTGFGDSVRRTVIGIAPSNPNVLYVLAETEGRGKEVPGSYSYPEFYSFWKYTYRSGDGAGSGGLWEDRSDNLPWISAPSWIYNGLSSYAMLVAVKPTDENTVFIGGSNLWTSGNGFSSTVETHWLGGYGEDGHWGGSGELHPDEHTLSFSRSDPNRILVGNDGGIFVGLLGGDPPQANWSTLADGYVTTQFYSVSLDHTTINSPLVLGGAQDNGSYVTTSASGTNPWGMLLGGDGCFCAVGNGGSEIYVSAQFGFIAFERIDAFGGLQDVNYIDLPDTLSSLLFVSPFALDPNDNGILYASGGTSVMLNTGADRSDAKNNWLVLDPTVIGTGQISALGVSTSAPQHRLYYGTTDGRVFRMDEANVPGSTPQEITGAGFPSGGYINCVTVDPLDARHAVVVFSNYNVQSLFMTTDAGESWTPIGGNLEQFPSGVGNGPSCRWASFLHRENRTILFVGTSTGLYSTDRIDGTATTWTQEGAATVGNVIVDMIDTRQSDGTVVVATWANGIYSTIINDFTKVPAETAAVEERMLRGNYPNPCREETQIDFDLPPASAGADVDLALYDERGSRVATLLEGRVDPGRHSVRFDPRRRADGPLPAGTYYYRLRAGDRIDTRALTVVR